MENGAIIMKGELEGMCEENVMAYFKITSHKRSRKNNNL
jgi:hypothetical protein